MELFLCAPPMPLLEIQEELTMTNKFFIYPILIVLFISLGISSCTKENKKETSESYSIAVFIPGVIAGSPTYEMMAKGAQKAIEETKNGSVKIIEGGFNQGEWLEKITVLASSKKYDLIVSTNPAMPAICNEVSKLFPNQKFFLLDGFLEGNQNIYTFRYNQVEQSFLSGYFAGLITSSKMEGANSDLKIGLIAGQEYPDMVKAILPGFSAGAKKVNNQITVDFRVVGNWYDAEKARSLSESMFNSGVDIILTIAGGANQGVITAAKDMGKYILMYDVSSYDDAPGIIIGSTEIKQERAAYEKIKLAINGEMQFGTAEIATVKDGWISFDNMHPLYLKNVTRDIQVKLDAIIKKLISGDTSLNLPVF
ncbi:MAG: BMP family ABC transporter substrate-binding protein [Bacteroidetes bacterium]|nr:MAG: BMP family ABC transporter substrate-binding protein [Bacteroidota bacterium]